MIMFRNTKTSLQKLEVFFKLFFFYKIFEKEFIFSRAVGVQQFC